MSDIREALSAAFEKVEGGAESIDAGGAAGSTGGAVAAGGGDSGGGGSVVAAAADAKPAGDSGNDGQAASGQPGRERDATGRFKPKPKDVELGVAKAEPEAKAESEAKAVVATPLAAAPPVAAPVAAPEHKPPQAWKPAAREHWTKLPPEVQAEIARVDKEAAETIRSGGEQRKVADAFRQVVAPYEHMIRAAGSQPLQVMSGLLQTAATLNHGAPGAKTQVMAQMIQHYGIDLDQLAHALTGGAAPRGGPSPQAVDPAALEQQVTQRILGNIQQRQEAAQRQRAAQDVSAWEDGKEFVNDVRGAMASLMESGEAKTLDEAYDLACWAKKDVRAIIQQREAKKTAEAANVAHQKAATASVSVKTQPTATASGGPKSVLQTLREAAAKVESGGR